MIRWDLYSIMCLTAGPSRRYARPLKRSACPASAQSGLTANPSLVTDWFGRIWFGLGVGRTGSIGPADKTDVKAVAVRRFEKRRSSLFLFIC